jgi:hypothetical protein
VVGRVTPAKGNLAVRQCDQAKVGDGDAVGIAAEILQDILGSAEVWFGLDDPIFAEERTQPGSEELGMGERSEFSDQMQLMVFEGSLQAGDELSRAENTFLATAAALAQENPPEAAVVPAPDNPLSAWNKMAHGRVKDILLRSAEKVHEENYNFKPTDAVRSFGQIVGLWPTHSTCFVPSNSARKIPP